ncbi:MAG: prepilin peptidase [Bacillota bacterium]|nr:prepilin peptidase [Bacillota bacterium]
MQGVGAALGFVFGLVWGSFFNVLIWRLPRLKSTGGRSHCTSCGHTLAPQDLVPLFSYLWLRGRCRYCGAGISARYPVVEGLTGVLSALTFLRVGPAPAALGIHLFYVAAMVVIFCTDLDRAIIPNAVVVPGLVVALAAALLRLDPFGPRLLMALAGGLAGGGFFLLLFVVTQGGGMGMGDVKLAAMMGLALGPLKLLVAVMIGSVSALVLVGVVLLRFRSRLAAMQSVAVSMDQDVEPDITERVWGVMVINGRPAVPFGAFLAVGFVVVLFYGDAIVRVWLGG